MTAHFDNFDGTPVLSLRSKLSLTPRIRLLQRFRTGYAEVNERADSYISPAAMLELIEDHFSAHDFLASVDGEPPRRYNFIGMIDARTLKKALNCPLDYGVARMHPPTFQLLEAFFALCALYPLKYV